jgi:ubiquinone/menaquinone biosynthesis C-methylase UbiE
MIYMYNYSNNQAKAFSGLNISGTTTEACFKCACKVFGSLKGKTALDFGCGSGRTTVLLKGLGTSKVVGVDVNRNMIVQANKLHKEKRLEFYKIRKKIPFKDNYFDAALSAHVLVESRSLKEMSSILKEIFRVLKNRSLLIIITANPKSIGHKYITYSHRKKKNLKSGDRIDCRIESNPPFIIKDTYWTEKDYNKVIKESGFKIVKIYNPLAKGRGWLEEIKVAPNSVYKCIKTAR